MKKNLKQIFAATLLTGIVSTTFLIPGAYAGSNIDTSVVDEKWGKPTFVYGGGLSQNQITETATLLEISNMENVASIDVTGKDLQTYLGDGSGSTSSMISSVLVKKEDKGSGVKVVINTPQNITEITKDQYANAAITAGVSDSTIVVAAIRPVTGESALTGVYKAFDVNGEELDQARMQVAQDELETVNHIVQENKKSDGFDAGKLDQAMVEIKQKLADLKEQQGKLATKEDIQRIINEALEKVNLEKVISQENINQLIILFQNYQETGAIDSQEVKTQLVDLANKVGAKAGEIYKQAEESGLIDQILNFFKNLIGEISKIFQK